MSAERDRSMKRKERGKKRIGDLDRNEESRYCKQFLLDLSFLLGTRKNYLPFLCLSIGMANIDIWRIVITYPIHNDPRQQ